MTVPTHVLWREDCVEFVDPEGYAPDNPDLVALPEGFDPEWMLPDFDTRTFFPNIDGRRAAKWEEVKAKRDALENGVALTPAGPVQCDNRSKIKINGMVMMAQLAIGAGQPFEEEFTLFDNSVITLDAQTATSLGVAVGAHVSAVFAVARVLRAEIDGASTLASIAAIDIEAAAWPTTAGE